MADIFQQRNDDIKNWDRENIVLLKAKMRQLSIEKYSGQMYGFLKSRYYFNQFKDIRGLGYKMPRHAIYVHKGVGRGQSIKQVGQGIGGKKRVPKPWFNEVMEIRLPQLASTVAKTDADIVANNLFIK